MIQPMSWYRGAAIYPRKHASADTLWSDAERVIAGETCESLDPNPQEQGYRLKTSPSYS